MYTKITDENGVPISQSNPLPVVMQTATGTTAERPSSPHIGMMYFDSTLGAPIWWNGAAWVDYSGTPI